MEYPSMYLAGSWDRRIELRRYAYTLRYEGFEITSRWLSEEHQPSGVEPTEAQLVQAAIEDIEDIAKADYFVRWSDPAFFSQKKTVPRKLLSASRMAETGIALALNKRIYILGGVQCDFLPQVMHFETLDAFCEWLSVFHDESMAQRQVIGDYLVSVAA